MALTRKKSLSFVSVSDSPQIVLIFSAAKDKLMIHRDVLFQVPYFVDAVATVKPEAGVIQLDYSSMPSAAGDWLASWLYTQTMPYSTQEINSLKSGDCVGIGRNMLYAYCLAVRLGLDEWANRIVDLFKQFHAAHLPLSTYWHELKGMDDDTCKLENLIMIMLIVSIRELGWLTYTTMVDTELKQKIKHGGDFALEIAEKLTGYYEFSTFSALKMSKGCQFHIHKTSMKC